MSSTLVDELIMLKDARITLKQQITTLKRECDRKTYFTRTSDILFQYYDLVDKDPSDQAAATEPAAATAASAAAPCKPTSILNYFSAPPPPTSRTDTVTSTSAATPVVAAAAKPHHTRTSLITKYMFEIDSDALMQKNIASSEHANTNAVTCNHCGSPDIVSMTNDGYSYCAKCHSIEYIIVDHDKPSYKDPPRSEVSYANYRRLNHLSEWLAQCQGVETTDIPDEVFDMILLEIKKERITNMAQLTHAKIKSLLKKLRLNKYYEHIPHILHKLTGMPMLHLSPVLEEKLRGMFKELQGPFLKHAPRNRKNFLSYSYCLHKLLQLLEFDHLSVHFPLLKSREKLHACDMVWKACCEELGWEFIKSI